MEDLLTATGLSEAQATTYLYLLKHGATAPPAVAAGLKLTRTNAYKILDSLVESGLVRKTELNKKFVYQAEDPIALTSLVATERNRVIALEQSVREAMHELRATYERNAVSTDVRSYRGNAAVKSLYISQAKQAEPIYFIKSRADIATMGYEAMHAIRTMPAKLGTQRYGITQDATEAIANPAIDRSGNLTRTWIDAGDYTAPVEWTVSGDELLIIDFDTEASAIRIKNPVVARAFKQLWQLLDRSLRQTPQYKQLPRKAGRKV